MIVDACFFFDASQIEYSDNASVFEEIVCDKLNKPIKTISTYNVSSLVVELNIITSNVPKKRHKKIIQR